MIVVVLIAISVRELEFKMTMLDFSDVSKLGGKIVLTTYVLSATSTFQLVSEHAKNFSHSMIMIKEKQQHKLITMNLK